MAPYRLNGAGDAQLSSRDLGRMQHAHLHGIFKHGVLGNRIRLYAYHREVSHRRPRSGRTAGVHLNDWACLGGSSNAMFRWTNLILVLLTDENNNTLHAPGCNIKYRWRCCTSLGGYADADCDIPYLHHKLYDHEEYEVEIYMDLLL